VRRENAQVAVTDESGHVARYDRVILACHADQALAMLSDADDHEHSVLREFKYHANTALLHTDAAVMPNTRRCYFRYGFHEDALTSALDLSRELASDVWN